METKNYIAIHFGKQRAAVLNLRSEGDETRVLDFFTVNLDPDTEQDQPEAKQLADEIARKCSEKNLTFDEVAIALDSALYMQHTIHSEFTDLRRIASTIGFDAEEALAMDVSEKVVAYKIVESSDKGSTVTVFTADQKVLSQIISSMQTNNLDPVVIVPDVYSLSVFIARQISIEQDSLPLFALLSGDRAYFIVPPSSAAAQAGNFLSSAARSFLLTSAGDRTALLTAQIPLTRAQAQKHQPLTNLYVFDSAGNVNINQTSENLHIKTEQLDLAHLFKLQKTDSERTADIVNLAAASGAALSLLEKPSTISFRHSFMPYQGKKMRLQRAAKFLSISAVVLIFSLGIYGQLELHKARSPVKELHKKFQQDYTVIVDKPKTGENLLKGLESASKKIRNIKGGRISADDEEAIVAKLTLVLKAFNKCANRTRLNINSISITSKNITIVGDTADHRSTLELRKALEQNELQILTDNVESRGGRNNFTITMIPKS